MLIAQEFVTDNGISIIGAAFFTGIFGLLGIVAKGVFDNKKETQDAREEASKARESADKAQANTRNVSNGFAGRMDSNFATLLDQQQRTNNSVDKLQQSFQDHLEWHLKKEGQ